MTEPMTPERLAEIEDRKVSHGPDALWTLKDDRDALLAEVRRLKGVLAEYGDEIARLESDHAGEVLRAERAEAEVARLRGELHAAETARDRHGHRAQQAEGERDGLSRRVISLEAERDRLRIAWTSARRRATEWRAAHDDADRDAKTWHKNAKRAEAERDRLLVEQLAHYTAPSVSCQQVDLVMRQDADKLKQVEAERDALRAELEQAHETLRAVCTEREAETNRADDAGAAVHRAQMVRVYRNEDGKEFVFADDLRAALNGAEGQS